jgi:ketopantoate reductase
VAQADGSPVPQAARDSAVAPAQTIEPAGFSSPHDDLAAGRRMEPEAPHGFVARRAAQHDLAAPCRRRYTPSPSPGPSRNQQPGT